MLKSPNEKCYIGQTIQLLSRRLYQHNINSQKDKDKGCRALYAAINKYGFDNFQFEVLIECSDNELNHYETEFIKQYNTLSPNGYNLTTGGDSNYKVSDETREIISKVVKERWGISSLPLYMGTVMKNNELIGYKIRFHPKDPKQVKFTNKTNLIKAYNDALNYLEMLNNGIVNNTHNIGRRRNEKTIMLPKYVYEYKENHEVVGYIIDGHPNKKDRKKFKCKNNPQIALENALAFLEKLNINES